MIFIVKRAVQTNSNLIKNVSTSTVYHHALLVGKKKKRLQT